MFENAAVKLQPEGDSGCLLLHFAHLLQICAHLRFGERRRHSFAAAEKLLILGVTHNLVFFKAGSRLF